MQAAFLRLFIAIEVVESSKQNLGTLMQHLLKSNKKRI